MNLQYWKSQLQLVRVPWKGKAGTKQSTRQNKVITTGEGLLINATEMAVNADTANITGLAGIAHHKGGSCNDKKVHFCGNKTKLHGFLSDNKKDLNTIIDKKISKAFS
eukprot:4599635-Ditylum_brightwellii.AAC.1